MESFAPKRPAEKVEAQSTWLRGVLCTISSVSGNGHCSDRSVTCLLPKAWTVLSLGEVSFRANHMLNQARQGPTSAARAARAPPQDLGEPWKASPAFAKINPSNSAKHTFEPATAPFLDALPRTTHQHTPCPSLSTLHLGTLRSRFFVKPSPKLQR